MPHRTLPTIEGKLQNNISDSLQTKIDDIAVKWHNSSGKQQLNILSEI